MLVICCSCVTIFVCSFAMCSSSRATILRRNCISWKNVKPFSHPGVLGIGVWVFRDASALGWGVREKGSIDVGLTGSSAGTVAGGVAEGETAGVAETVGAGAGCCPGGGPPGSGSAKEAAAGHGSGSAMEAATGCGSAMAAGRGSGPGCTGGMGGVTFPLLAWSHAEMERAGSRAPLGSHR
ncbi:hypothetical protein O6H91_02G010400 [Diphasiastrum complanatum]|uniref:Uncharacterized protein n=1 Tax=Diphasiastrum complanatum TaxID=34168 RepID=A0ACC2ECH8_DIPCM|nr:hypothetical protein O6H91_02G010400 [Diphasiastrum complanatum]